MEPRAIFAERTNNWNREAAITALAHFVASLYYHIFVKSGLGREKKSVVSSDSFLSLPVCNMSLRDKVATFKYDVRANEAHFATFFLANFVSNMEVFRHRELGKVHLAANRLQTRNKIP